jgi:MoxR-like ATPase
MTSREKIQAVIDEMGKVVIGQERLINRLLVGLFTGGHVLLEGVPGLAKTLTINTLAKILDLLFHPIQFPRDFFPAD